MQIYKEMQGNDFLSQDSNYFWKEEGVIIGMGHKERSF